MQIRGIEYQGFDWDAHNEAKIRLKHGLSRPELERFFARALMSGADVRHSQEEPRYIVAGPDDRGRPMLAVFTLRVIEGRTLLRPITARRMRDKEARRYA